jgi:hypothetical protein
MKKKIVAAAALATLLAAGVASSATDIEDLEKAVNKYAVTFGNKPKGLCVCLDSGAFYYGATGFLERQEVDNIHRFVQVACEVEGFNASTGARDFLASCQQFAPLAK